MTKVIASSETNTFDTIANFIRTPSTKKLLGWAAVIIFSAGIGWELISKGNDSKVDALSNQGQATTAVSETTTSQTEQAATTQEILPTVESLRLDPSLFNNPEELVKTYFNDRETAWLNAGSNAINTKEAYRQSGLIENFANQKAAELDKVFIESLIIKNYKTNSSLTTLVDNFKNGHARALDLFIQTNRPDLDRADIKPYRETKEYIDGSLEVLNTTKDKNGDILSMTIRLAEKQTYNNGENTAPSLVPDPENLPNGTIFYLTYTFTKESDSIKVSDVILAKIQ